MANIKADKHWILWEVDKILKNNGDIPLELVNSLINAMFEYLPNKIFVKDEYVCKICGKKYKDYYTDINQMGIFHCGDDRGHERLVDEENKSFKENGYKYGE